MLATYTQKFLVGEAGASRRGNGGAECQGADRPPPQDIVRENELREGGRRRVGRALFFFFFGGW